MGKQPNTIAGSNLSGKKVRLLTFSCEGHRFGFDAHHLASIVRLPEICTKQEGASTIEQYLGISGQNSHTISHALYFKDHSGAGPVITVNGPVNLVEFPAESVYPIPGFVKSRSCYKKLLALAEADDGYFFLLSRP